MCSFLPSELQVGNNITVMSSYVTDMCSFLLSELEVGNNITVMSSYVTDMCSFLQGLTQVEEMLISGVLPIMSLYRLPHGQYAYSGHVINLPQDVASFVNSLPRLPTELDIIVVRKQGAADSHHDFRVRRSVVLAALQCMVTRQQPVLSQCSDQ